jgi:hypothetical protein
VSVRAAQPIVIEQLAYVRIARHQPGFVAHCGADSVDRAPRLQFTEFGWGFKRVCLPERQLRQLV